ncbi:MAG: superoxide dismutase [Rhodobacteraceae bacterium]|nr:superoxide dismutase [Paracoccaceae bacterium]
MAFTLPDLPYAHDALAAGGMSRETLEYHHDLHHKAYVDKGNELIAGTPFEGAGNDRLEEVIKGTYGAEAHQGLFNQVSQHWNHIQFWAMMGPNPSGMPSELESKIAGAFGSVDEFKKQFIAAGMGQFGSGWCWLVLDGGALKITKTPNGVNPICFGQTALLGCDVWEHSYYIDYRNKRPAYLENFLSKLVNWENVTERLRAVGGV